MASSSILLLMLVIVLLGSTLLQSVSAQFVLSIPSPMEVLLVLPLRVLRALEPHLMLLKALILAVFVLLARPWSAVSALAVLVENNPLLAALLVKHAPPDTTTLVHSTHAKSVLLDIVAQHQPVPSVLLVVTGTALAAPTAVLDNTLLKAPRSVYSALEALVPTLEELPALNALLVPSARLSLLPLVQLAQLVLFQRRERMFAPHVSQVPIRMELSALLAQSIPTLILEPQAVLPALLVSLL
jgi:hypothetical protein